MPTCSHGIPYESKCPRCVGEALQKIKDDTTNSELGSTSPRSSEPPNTLHEPSVGGGVHRDHSLDEF